MTMYIVCYASNSLCAATTCFHKHSPDLINSGFMARLRVCARDFKSRFWSVMGYKKRKEATKLSETTSYIYVYKDGAKKRFNFSDFFLYLCLVKN